MSTDLQVRSMDFFVDGETEKDSVTITLWFTSNKDGEAMEVNYRNFPEDLRKRDLTEFVEKIDFISDYETVIELTKDDQGELAMSYENQEHSLFDKLSNHTSWVSIQILLGVSTYLGAGFGV